MKLKVLLIGSGGREHAIAWKLAQSNRLGKLFIAPGNGRTSQFGENVSIAVTDIQELLGFAKRNAIDLTIVGPDDPLALGVVDAFWRQGLRVFGPTRKATMIESSKQFAKTLMTEAGIPTADFRIFRSYKKAIAYIRTCILPIVIKASGLALGKGVFICRNLDEAEGALNNLMVHRVYGNAGATVIIETFLTGQEVSVHALCDGRSHSMFPSAQDHKAVGENDTGKNTGGMGAIAPVPWFTSEMMQVADNQVRQVLAALANKQRPFVGCLYPGLMVTPDGIQVLEINSRFGDPEAQVYLRLLKTDLIDVIEACLNGTLHQLSVEWHPGYAVCIVLVSGGYPDAYLTGFPIFGVEEAARQPGVVVFHAGTTLDDGQFYTAGGRVLGISAVAPTLEGALEAAYNAISYISFEGMIYRRDIGKRLLPG